MEPAETAASGGFTADDHLNAALAGDRLWLATKNSVDTDGQSQLVLRVRTAAGLWRNFPYAPKTAAGTPSRPIAVATPDGRALLLGQTNYAGGDPTHDSIGFGLIGADDVAVDPVMTTVIAPDPALKAHVNDITGPKRLFPFPVRGSCWPPMRKDGFTRRTSALSSVRPDCRPACPLPRCSRG